MLDPFQSFRDIAGTVASFLIFDIRDDPGQIFCPKRYDPVAVLPLQSFRAVKLIDVMRACPLYSADPFGGLQRRRQADSQMYMRFDPADRVDDGVLGAKMRSRMNL